MPYDSAPETGHGNAFVGPDVPSFADLIARLEADASLGPTRRRDLISALRRLAKLLNKDPAAVPAHPAWLRERLKRVQAKQADLSAKSFANIKADAMAALRHAGVARTRASHLCPLTPRWQALWDRIPAARMRWNLSRFFHYASGRDLAPEEVTDAAIEAFHRALADESLVASPDQIRRRTVALWNEAVDTVPGWPLNRLSPPAKHEGWTLPLEAFPASFRNDVDAWLARLAGGDPLAEEAPDRPVRPATLRHRRFQIRMAASALVRRGLPVEAITALADLVDVGRFREVLDFLLDRSGRRPTGAIHGLATGLKAIARHHVGVDDAHLKRLRTLCRKMDPKRAGLTAKNRARLRQFDDARNVAKLLWLPDALMRRAAKAERRDRKAAVPAQLAVAIEILLMAPIRIKNLATLKIDENLIWSRPGRHGPLHLVIPAADVKNGEPLEFELPEESAQRIRLYLDRFRPLLGGRPGEDWLFPGRFGGPKNVQGFGAQIKAAIRAETGLVVNAHLFRHLGAKLFLDANPGAYEVVRRVHGHRSIDTTTGSYTGFESKAAARHFDGTILKLRGQALPGAKVRKPRKA